MENTIEQVRDYLLSHDEDTRNKIMLLMVAKKHGLPIPTLLLDPTCTPDNCHDSVGCSRILPNSYCACVDGVCTEIPEG